MKGLQILTAVLVLFAFTVGAAGTVYAKDHKVEVCHNIKPIEDPIDDGDDDWFEGTTIYVSGNGNAVDAHLAHGDVMGPCDPSIVRDIDGTGDSDRVFERPA